MRGIGKSFPGVRALSDVSLTLSAGEVLVLVGENGAGKSTLMKILAGALQADEGEIFIDGARVRIDTPQEAQRLGIGMIYQEFTLVPQLTVPANISLGAEPTRAAFIDASAVRARARRALDELGCGVTLRRSGFAPIGRPAAARRNRKSIGEVRADHRDGRADGRTRRP